MPALRTALIVASVAASETSGTATEEISAECVGEDCNLLENLPCRQEHRFDIGLPADEHHEGAWSTGACTVECLDRGSS